MKMLTERRTSGSPPKDLYDPDVAKVKRMSIEEFRANLGNLAKQASAGEMDEHVLVTRHGAVGVIAVPADWYRRAREALGDPTDL